MRERKCPKMVLLELFWSFLKIGFTSFGGLSMIPLISSEMVSHGWMNAGEVSDIVAIAEMTPGPLGLNCATFAGIKTAGIAGAVAANLGVLMPTFTVCLFAAACFERFKNGRRMGQIMVGVRPVCIGLILAVMVSLSMTNYYIDSAVNYVAVGIGVLDLFLLVKCKVSIPKVLLVSALLGVILI